MKIVLLLVALLFATSAWAQAVFQVDAGGGDLLAGGGVYTEGIGLTTYFPRNTIRTSLALRGHHVLVGASDEFMIGKTSVVAGDQAVGLNAGNVGVALGLKGLAVRRRREPTCRNTPTPTRAQFPASASGQRCTSGIEITAFAGATGTGVFLPFSTNTKAQHIAVGGLFQQQFSAAKLSTFGVVEGGQHTLLEAAEYRYRRSFVGVGSAGMLNNQRFAQGQAILQPVRFISLYGNHSSYFAPTAATGNGVGASLNVWHLSGSAGWNQGTAHGVHATGTQFGAGFRYGWISTQSSYYRSTNQKLLTHSVTESMRRWTLTEIINQMPGRNSYSYGIGYHGNRVSVSVSHNVQFLLGRGYQQVLGISINLRIHDTSVSASTVTNPVTGKTLWSTGGEQFIQAEGLALPGHETHHGGGKHLITGRCEREDGTPQEGCAISIAGSVVYSNSRGEFESHQKKKAVPVASSVNDFSAPGRWQIVQLPVEAEEGQPIKMIVRRL